MDLKRDIIKNLNIPQPEVKAYGVVRDSNGNIKGEIPKPEMEEQNGSDTTDSQQKCNV